MRISLIGINSKFIHSNLAIRYLKSYTKELNYELRLQEFTINDRKERVLEEILRVKADVIAFSCYIWNIEYIQNLTKLIKLIDNNVEILYGGPEVSYDCIDFLNVNNGEYLIEGEGEETFKEFVEYKLMYRNIESIKGLYYKKEGKIFYGGQRSLMDINDTIFPYDEEDNLDNKIVYYESSRGCPFNCSYCLSSTINGVRFLNIDRVKKELTFLMNKGVKLIKFVDRTFNCNSNFSKEIWKFLIDCNTKTVFHFEISADILKKDEIELLANAPEGRFQFEIGVQTTNNDVLKNVDRNVSFKDIKEKSNELKKLKNIKQHLDLIAGLPGENYESFKKSFNDLYSIYPNEIQLGFLKLLKGCSLRNDADKLGIVYSPFVPYEVLKTNEISYEDLLKLKKVEEMVDKYYNSQKFNNIIKYFLQKYNTPYDFYYDLAMFFYEKGYFERSLSAAEYYNVFLEFNSSKLKEGNENLNEVIKFDYLKYNKKKWVPDFINRNLDKTKEKMIKEKVLNKYSKGELNNFHIEYFDIDIFTFIKEGRIDKIGCYLIFDEKDIENIIKFKE